MLKEHGTSIGKQLAKVLKRNAIFWLGVCWSLLPLLPLLGSGVLECGIVLI